MKSLKNFINITKDNEYFKYYIRFIKENKLYKTKHKNIFISEDRIKSYYELNEASKETKYNSIYFNMEIPNILISNNLDFDEFVKIYNKYNREIAQAITKQIIRQIILKHNLKLTKKEIENKQLILINYFKKTLYPNNNNNNQFLTIDELINKLKNKINIIFEEKFTNQQIKNIICNITNNKMKI